MLLALFDIAHILLQVLMWIIIIQAILSWLVAFNVINTRNDFVRSFLNALDRLTRPLYRPIRRILPDFGGIDFSPIVVILIIIVLDRLLLALRWICFVRGRLTARSSTEGVCGRLRARVAAAVPAFAAQAGRAPGLAVVLVGEDPATASTSARRQGDARRRMASFEHLLGHDTPESDLLDLVDGLNRDENVDGILVQLPLPPQIDGKKVIGAIDPAKDVDGFHPVNAGRLAVGEDGFVPCTPLGCLMLLKDRLGDLAGLEAVVIGRSNIVGKPMAQLLLKESCTVTIAHSRTRDLPAVVRRADIVVAAVGRPEMVSGDWLKPGATVIDVGINRIEGKLVGDVDFASASRVAGAITPVPGGIGPMTIAVLLRNTLVAAFARAGLAAPEGL